MLIKLHFPSFFSSVDRGPHRHLLYQRAGEPSRDSGHRGCVVHLHHREHLPFALRGAQHFPAGDAAVPQGVQERDISL